MSLTFIDLFAGIGGFRLGMELAGHKCVGFCEIDKYARQTYKANFDTEGEWEAHDITTVTNTEIERLRSGRTIDVICGGFPCQAFSVAGNRLGFADTRGTLFFEICRFAEIIKPKYLFLENVKGLLSHDKGRTFFIILDTLDRLGYDVEWQVLNSKDFGVPQNRERVFIIGHLRGQCIRKIFPFTTTNKQTVKQLIGGHQSYRVYGTSGLSRTLVSQAGGMGAKTGLYFINQPRFKQFCASNTCQTSRVSGDVVMAFIPAIQDKPRIRRLTPLECFRLQGFPDSHYHNAKKASISDNQLYKQAGNSVTINVVYEIAKKLE